MTKVDFELDSKAARELMRSPQMQADLRRRAEELARRMGPGFEVKVTLGANRARATITAKTRAARLRQAREHVIERVMGSG